MAELDDQLERWLTAGIIDRRQADAIRAAEEARAAGDDLAPTRSVPVAAEALGYVGGGLALLAAVIAAAEFWADMRVWARILLLALATAVALSAGALLRSSTDGALRRLVSVLWLAASAGTAAVATVFGVDVFDFDEAEVALLVGLATAAVSVVLWRDRPMPLQHLALYFSLLTAFLAGLAVVFGTAQEEFFGLAVTAAGIAWGVLVWGRLAPPRVTGYAVASLTVLVGLQIFAEEFRGAGLLLGVLAAVALMAAAVRLGELVLLGVGAVGLLVFAVQVVFEYFEDTLGAPLALFLAGVVLLGAALVTARLQERVRARSRRTVDSGA